MLLTSFFDHFGEYAFYSRVSSNSKQADTFNKKKEWCMAYCITKKNHYVMIIYMIIKKRRENLLKKWSKAWVEFVRKIHTAIKYQACKIKRKFWQDEDRKEKGNDFLVEESRTIFHLKDLLGIWSGLVLKVNFKLKSKMYMLGLRES